MLTPPQENTKKAWRKVTRGLRKELVAAESETDRAAQGVAVARHALELLTQVRGQLGVTGAVVTAYESWEVEPPTEALIAMLQDAGVRVLVPVTLPDMDLDWRDAGAPDELGSRLGLDAIGLADLVLVPAQAVDIRTGARLGQGGGCYDRALPRRSPDAPVFAIVNPHESAELDLPEEDTDVRVTGTLTADGVRRVPPERPEQPED